MFRVSSLIREDREFAESILALKEAKSRKLHSPTLINGLSGGAVDAYLCEAVLELQGSGDIPTLILPNDDECVRVKALFESVGIESVVYKPRDFVFNNISASHDIERERLSVLHSLISGGKEIIITTPAAAELYTMPYDVLAQFSLELKVGDEISPVALTERLVSMGFARSEIVEGRGAVSHRGGIVDFFPEGDLPVRIEFFGDEVDRLVYFDPVTQRSMDVCPRVEILPAREVLIDENAKAKMLREVDICLKNAELSDDVRAKLSHERVSIASGVGVEFRDKYFGVIYERYECLFDYLFSVGRDTFIVLGTAACRESGDTFKGVLEDRISGLKSYGAATSKMTRY